MAVPPTKSRKIAVIIFIAAGILVIAASAAMVHLHNHLQGPDRDISRINESRPEITVGAATGLQYYYNTTRDTNTGHARPKSTVVPVNTIVPSSNSGSGPSGITPVHASTAGSVGRIPATGTVNITKPTKYPVSQLKPVLSKPLPAIKPVPVNTLKPVQLPTPAPTTIRTTIIVDNSTRQAEQRIFYYTNIERANVGKPALVWDEQLAIIGRDHSIDMAARSFFSHINPSGETPGDRAARHGYNVELDFGTYVRVGVAENIAMVSNIPGTPDDIAKFIVNAWVNSPGHYANIIDSNEQKLTRLGVGVAYDEQTNTWYASQEFF